jgi:TrkA domain protein
MTGVRSAGPDYADLPDEEHEMNRVQVMKLPGVGVMRTFLTAADDWIGVVELRSGSRQLFVDDPADPDTRRLAAELQPHDCRILAELLGAHEDSGPAPEETFEPVDWVLVHPDSPAAGRTIAEVALRTETGASIVAVLRDRTYTDIEPSFELRANDIVILTGGQPALAAATKLLRP